MAAWPFSPARWRSTLPGADVAAQTRNILDRIDVLLRRIGTDRTRILSATIWLADISTFHEMNCRLGRVGAGGPGAGARDSRGKARRTAVFGRDRHHRRDIVAIRRSADAGPKGRHFQNGRMSSSFRHRDLARVQLNSARGHDHPSDRAQYGRIAPERPLVGKHGPHHHGCSHFRPSRRMRRDIPAAFSVCSGVSR